MNYEARDDKYVLILIDLKIAFFGIVTSSELTSRNCNSFSEIYRHKNAANYSIFTNQYQVCLLQNCEEKLPEYLNFLRQVASELLSNQPCNICG